MTANALVSASLHPPLVVFCVSSASSTLRGIQRTSAFAVNILAADQEPLARVFAQARVNDKFDKVEWSPASTGSPIIEGCVAWLDCELEVTHQAGDHLMVVARVVGAELGVGDPLIFHRSSYRSGASLAPLSQ